MAYCGWRLYCYLSFSAFNKYLTYLLVSSISNSLGVSCVLTIIFLHAAGKLVDNKIPWRGDSALKDGSQAKLDLTKGMYDAGDNMKFGFPMAFTATVLSWAILEYGDQMDHVGQLEPAQNSLKWITDYLINAHPSENVLYIQVTVDPSFICKLTSVHA